MAEALNRDITEYVDKVALIVIDGGKAAKKQGKSEIDDLLEIVKSYRNDELEKVIAEKMDYRFLYHFSRMRGNVISWLPIRKEDRVLEIGSECGAVTDALLERSGLVVSIDESYGNCLVNATRHKSYDNLIVYAGNVDRALELIDEKFDYIVIENQVIDAQMANKLNLKLTNNGQIIAISKSKATFGHYNELWKDHTVHVRYAYPNTDLMLSLYSDERPKGAGEGVFYEKYLGDGTNPYEFPNSYISIINGDCRTIYAKFSNERIRDYALVTTEDRNDESRTGLGGEYVIKKQMVFKEGYPYVEKMQEHYRKLAERFEGKNIEINRMTVDPDNPGAAYFEFVNGRTLTEILDEKLFGGRQEEFYELLERYLDVLTYNVDYPITDYDAIFDNIIVSNDKWVLIDYEWSFDKATDPYEIAFRAFHTYLVSKPERNKLNQDIIKSLLNITPERGELLCKDEKDFQDSIKGGLITLADFYNEMQIRKNKAKPWLLDPAYRFQVYRADKKGHFSEADSFFVDEAYGSFSDSSVSIEVSRNDKLLRIDPLMAACRVCIKSVSLDGKVYAKAYDKVSDSSGRMYEDGKYSFDTSDPFIIFNLKKMFGRALPRKGCVRLNIELVIDRVN